MAMSHDCRSNERKLAAFVSALRREQIPDEPAKLTKLILLAVCGTAVAEDADQLVEDVRQRPNYLACSAKVRSEIVVLIRSAGRVVGQIDMDSERVAGFSADDACVLKAVADSFGGLLAGLPA
mgnify:CR=1 FL=1